MKLIFFTLVFLLWLPKTGWSAVTSEQTCFENEAQLPEFLRTIAESSMTGQELLDATSFSCVELLDIHSADPGPLQNHARFAQKNWDIPVLGPVSVKIAEYLSGAESLRLEDVRRDFSDQLKAIRSIKNRYERIHQTYRLVNQYQGKYDRTSKMPILSTNPKDTLERSAETSYGGVCRQFAELLKWSLNQVNHQDSDVINETFTATIASSWDHMWVRVKLPSENGNGFSEETIDLDNTDFPRIFVPLRSRTALSEDDRRAFDQQCHRIHSCLRESLNNK